MVHLASTARVSSPSDAGEERCQLRTLTRREPGPHTAKERNLSTGVLDIRSLEPIEQHGRRFPVDRGAPVDGVREADERSANKIMSRKESLHAFGRVGQHAHEEREEAFLLPREVHQEIFAKRVDGPKKPQVRADIAGRLRQKKRLYLGDRLAEGEVVMLEVADRIRHTRVVGRRPRARKRPRRP